jgi:membrane-bound lytic murein transglycosylase D
MHSNKLVQTAICTVFMSSIFLGGCSSFKDSPDNQKIAVTQPSPAPTKKVKEITEQNIWGELISGYGLPQVEDAQVENQLRWYSNNQQYLTRVTEQAEPYLHYVMTELKNNNLPLELALLPIVESAYNPFAKSSSKALGIWQFIPLTGRHFGLAQNNWYDGRRDIVASTDAAVRYLTKLHAMFEGDWLLAIAAYNAGEGTVRRAINKNIKLHKPTDFWSLPLPDQTRKYVPQLLALAKVVAEPEKYELTLNSIPDAPYFTRINVDGPIDLDKAAQLAEVDPQELRKLNAGYSQWFTNPSGPHELLIPIADVSEFTLILSELPALKNIQTTTDYKVKAGDTLGAIAKRFNTSINSLQAANNLKTTNLKIGQRIEIPGSDNVDAAPRPTPGDNFYQVKSGDSFWTIAKKHNTNVKSLLQWNSLAATAKLKPGQKLLIANQALAQNKEGKIIYQIKQGDTLVNIANRFSISKETLLSWNNVKNESYIHPGQELTIYLSAKN